MSVCVYVCECVYVYVNVCMCVYVHVCVHVYVHVCMHVCGLYGGNGNEMEGCEVRRLHNERHLMKVKRANSGGNMMR